MHNLCCLWNFSENLEKAELGYELNKAHQRKGYMGEAVKVVIAFAFNNLKIKNLEAYTHIDNAGSISLLRKNSFRLEEIFKDQYLKKSGEYDMMVFVLENDE